MSASRSVRARRRRVFEAVALAVCCALALFGLGVPTSVGISAAVADEGQSSAATLDPPDTSDPAGPKALPDEATANSNSWVLPDGQMRTDVYGAPVNYQKPSGDWAPIDNQLVDSSASGVAVTNAANDYSAALPEDAGSKPVRFSADDR